MLTKDGSGSVTVRMWYDDKWLNSRCVLKIEPIRFADGFGMSHKGKSER